MAGLLGPLYHACSAAGLIAAGGAAQATQRANLLALTPVVTSEQARAMLSRGVVFVDARHEFDYQAGHIPGAINVPIGATVEQRRASMASVPKSAKLVIYCQSLSCPYAEVVARRLERDGYTHVSMFRAGWQEWNGQ